LAESAVATTTEKLYEGMFLLDSSKFASDPDGVTAHLLGIVEKAGGSVVAHRPWQDGKLAYEIAGRRKGMHYLIYFRMPGSGVTDINRSVRLSDRVVRHLLIRHSQSYFDASVAAITPAAAEPEPEAPAEEAAAPVAETAGDDAATEKAAD
jgi:small subunit ribosomal protein S6